jgi:hypothetical protein
MGVRASSQPVVIRLRLAMSSRAAQCDDCGEWWILYFFCSPIACDFARSVEVRLSREPGFLEKPGFALTGS